MSVNIEYYTEAINLVTTEIRKFTRTFKKKIVRQIKKFVWLCKEKTESSR